MIENIKSLDGLTVDDFKVHPVWEFLNDDELGEMMMQPVDLPIESLDNSRRPGSPRQRLSGMGTFRKFRRHKPSRHPALPAYRD